MVNASFRLIENPMTSLTEPMGELRLKVIGNPHELFIKASEPQGDFAPHHEIAAHKLLDPTRLLRGEFKDFLTCPHFSVVPWLHHAPGDQGRSCFVGRAQMLLKQARFRDDVIIDE
jgi:hypothetical protein